MSFRSIEIMAPVGSYESLAAAIQGGADAVYFGVGELNMRSRSSANFTLDDLSRISKICQEHHVRTYLTINTIVYDNELNAVQMLVNAAVEHEINAVIASDWSVIEYARKVGMKVHVSTQCNITNIEAVRFFARYADVMVMARELTLKQVAAIVEAIQKENITTLSGKLVAVEMFVHGALCMAISGKCYLSLDHFNYSANRGACLQPCRRQYHVKDTENEVETIIDNAYIMSPKDLCTIGFLDKILHAGVRVLKIEGRGRSPEYVKTVTRCYREAVNAYFSGNYNEDNVKKWLLQLQNVYNRGFWDGYYLGRTLGEWTQRYGSQAKKTKVYIGKITNFFAKLNVAEVKIEANQLLVGDEILIMGETTGVYEDTIPEIRLDLQSVLSVSKGDICSIKTGEVVRRNDKLYKIIPTCDAEYS